MSVAVVSGLRGSFAATQLKEGQLVAADSDAGRASGDPVAPSAAAATAVVANTVVLNNTCES